MDFKTLFEYVIQDIRMSLAVQQNSKDIRGGRDGGENELVKELLNSSSVEEYVLKKILQLEEERSSLKGQLHDCKHQFMISEANLMAAQDKVEMLEEKLKNTRGHGCNCEGDCEGDCDCNSSDDCDHCVCEGDHDGDRCAIVREDLEAAKSYVDPDQDLEDFERTIFKKIPPESPTHTEAHLTPYE